MKLKKIRDIIFKEKKESIDLETYNITNLTEKINEYLKWYENTFLDLLPASERQENISKVKNLIDKMTIWYELRYPNYEVLKQIPCKSPLCIPYENKDINSIMFDRNSYINILFDKKSDVRQIDWQDFYNPNVFINALTKEERALLTKPKYPNTVEFENLMTNKLHLSNTGLIEDSDHMPFLRGKTVEEAIKALESNGLHEYASVLKDVEEEYHKDVNKKEGLLDSVMYNIIEKGGPIYGPRRALLFAHEFIRDIDIPMMYGLSGIPINLNIDLVKAYLKIGGTKHLKCFINYFSSNTQDQQTKISLEKLLEKYKSDLKREREEILKRESYQKLVNVLASRLKGNELTTEEVKKKSLK